VTGDWWFGLVAGVGACLVWWVVDRHRPRYWLSRFRAKSPRVRGDAAAGLLVLVGDPPFEPLPFDLIPAGATRRAGSPPFPTRTKTTCGPTASSSPICTTVGNGGPGPRLAVAGGNGPNCGVALETVAAPTPAFAGVASKVISGRAGGPPTGQCRLHAAPPSVVLPGSRFCRPRPHSNAFTPVRR
jgi:hypothetical protein